MAEPLKNIYNASLINAVCREVKSVNAPFPVRRFKAHVLDDAWDARELKDRMNHVADMLRAHLPDAYRDALDILKQVSPKFSGLEHLFFPAFIERFGVDDYDASIDALALFTEPSSSEFAVRPFIVKYGKRMMTQMEAWAASNNHHIRRLASEGCRPRLPWAMALPEFKADPAPVLRVLRKLKHDDSEYVRRSVANNLNDIAKDHPDVTLGIARQWLGKSTDTDRLIKHACRTLLKQGHPEALGFFGFTAPDHVTLRRFRITPSVARGDALEFSFDILSDATALGKIRLEYAIDFLKKNGTLSRKVFQLSESHIDDRQKQVSMRHFFRPISTRVYYCGTHRLAIIVNGKALACKTFKLTQAATP